MVNAIAGYFRPNPLTATVGQHSVQVTKTGKENEGVLAALGNMWSKAKGVSDLFALGYKTADVAILGMPKEIASYTREVSTHFKQARTALSVPYFLTVSRKFCDSRDYRDALEVASIGNYAASNFVAKGLGKTLGQTGSAFKTVLDGVDCNRTISEYYKYSKLSTEANAVGSNVSKEVKQGISGKLSETSLKVMKYFLGFLSGLVGVGVFFGMVFAQPVIVAALVATMASAVFGFAADYGHETAPFHAKITAL